MTTPNTTRMTSLVLIVALIACTERDAPSTDGGVTVAQVPTVNSAPTMETTTSETAQSPNTTRAEPGVRVNAVTYDDVEAVYRKGRYADAAGLFGAFVTSHPQSTRGHY